MNPKLVFGVLIILGLIWTAVWGWVLLGARQTVAYTEVAPKTAALRRRLFYLLLPLFVIVFLASLGWLPYRAARANRLGSPQTTINVTAQQWEWIFDQTEIPARAPVEFVVTSKDVNHGFAIFDPQGQLVTQVQAMPGYTNHLIYVFDQPGTYAVRCLELCGIAHHGMVTTLTVK